MFQLTFTKLPFSYCIRPPRAIPISYQLTSFRTSSLLLGCSRFQCHPACRSSSIPYTFCHRASQIHRSLIFCPSRTFLCKPCRRTSNAFLLRASCCYPTDQCSIDRLTRCMYPLRELCSFTSHLYSLRHLSTCIHPDQFSNR